MPRMNQEEIEAFIGRWGGCKLACLDTDGHPYIVPLGYLYVEGGFHFYARERSAWAPYLQRDGRVSLCIDEKGMRRVLIKGHAKLIEGPIVGGWLTEQWQEENARLGQSESPYVVNVLKEPYWHFIVHPTKITSWQGRDWAERYKHSDWHV